MNVVRLKKELKGGKAVFGIERTIKNIKLGKTKTVFLAKNCPERFKEKIKLYTIMTL